MFFNTFVWTMISISYVSQDNEFYNVILDSDFYYFSLD